MHAEEMIQRCSPWDGYVFDPLSYIQAVNYLCQYDKASIIAIFREYVQSGGRRLPPESTKVFFLLRLLFEPVEGGGRLPAIAMGKLMDAGTPSPEDLPLYPLVSIKDVPLLIVPGFYLGGLPEDPTGHIDLCEQFCRVRSRSLTPPDNPLSLSEELLSSPGWYRDVSQEDRAILRAQLLRMVRNAYPVQDIFSLTFYSRLMDEAVWEKYKKTFDGRRAAWDPNENNYRSLA
jgi:hypothetical protein